VIESVYGLSKRLKYVAGIVAEFSPKRVLDVGCGTGANLTVLLAQRFPGTTFVGIDSDQASIAYANRVNSAGNAQYFVEAALSDTGTFDLVIASEVIEHVEDPDAFLNSLRGFLAPDGKLVLTLPNGLGPFELVSFVETVMHLTGIYRVLRACKRMLRPGAVGSDTSDTLAISPHINFFSYGQIRSVIAGGGFRILSYQPRTFLCGFGFDHLIRSPQFIAWNAEVADRLPPQLVSAWMFLLSPCVSKGGQVFRRSRFARFRRFLNEKRWNLR
jgi:SAM-dependent methyltransferase